MKREYLHAVEQFIQRLTRDTSIGDSLVTHQSTLAENGAFKSNTTCWSCLPQF